ncbi:CPBP family intramembrane glutamic endopeptidase [uncultured Polaribacter sp.]|uniref:CPBP family intramembrane glutamic endopeptidase n=1 Tax=uncultured Polaribacter sp. TaxID=174711 RepID=UPI00262B9CFC|nr:CPBP family intramembrane glutamic endopeptidase [uncultured Polaribacter sp.]
MQKDPNTDFSYRLNVFGKLLAISIITGFIVSPLFVLLEHVNLIDANAHKLDKMFEGMNNLKIFLLSAILAPVLEEVLFRAPLTLFRNKITFKVLFYVLTILFGFIHITNFEISTNVILLSPLLVLPQILLGVYLGFIRVRFGLLWSIGLHAAYNGILITLSFLENF